jgi:hypothetical protein
MTSETRKRHVREELATVTGWIMAVLKGENDDTMECTLTAIQRLSRKVRLLKEPE